MKRLIVILFVLSFYGCSGNAELKLEIEKLTARLDSLEARSAAVITTRRLQIVNENGETTIEAASFPSGEGGEITVKGPSRLSKAKIVITAGVLNPSIELVNSDGITVVSLVDKFQGGNLHLHDFEGNEKMWIFASRSGSGLYGFSKEGNVVLSARVDGNSQMGNFKSFSDKDKYNHIWTALTDQEMMNINVLGEIAPEKLKVIDGKLQVVP